MAALVRAGACRRGWRDLLNFLIAPSEGDLLKSLGTVSSVPERHGADVLWAERAVRGLIGVQRKELSDLIESSRDGRLSKEVAQLRSCKLAFLLVEGRPQWTVDGVLVHRYAVWTRRAHHALLRSVQLRGIVVEFTDSLSDTVARVEEIADYAAKGSHTSLDRRPKPMSDGWGKLTDEAWGCHLLQSVDGIGPTQAKAIWDYFNGHLPIGLTVPVERLAEIKGLGPKRLTAIRRAFGAESI